MGAMVDAFVFLTTHSIKNRVLLRVRRLREPRYLLGSVVGAGYFYVVFLRRAFSARPQDHVLAGAIARNAGSIELVASVLLLIYAAFTWLGSGTPTAMTFTQSEVQFLFPAPVTRKQLLNFKLLRSQLGLLFTSLISVLVVRASWMFAVGLWIVLTTISLYSNGVALRRQSLADHGTSGWARQGFPALAFLAAIGVLVWTVVQDWSALAIFNQTGDVWAELQRLATSSPIRYVLLPFQAVVRLPFAATPSDFTRALPVSLALVAAAYSWALRSDASFEEASAAQAEERALQKTDVLRAPKKAGRAPFDLGLEGPAEFAILWKNLLMLGRYASLTMLFRLLPLVVLLPIFLRSNREAGAVSSAVAQFALMLAAYATLLGPMMARNDLRQDLASLPVLKTWPIRGVTLLRGELLAPWILLTVVAWMLLLTGSLLAERFPEVLMRGRVSYTAAAMLVVPGLILVQLVVQNAIAVMFPAWVSSGTTRPRGIDAMGQRMLMMFGSLLALIAGLLPALLAAGAAAFTFYGVTGGSLVVLPAAIVGIALVGECWIAVTLLGPVLDRTDPTAIEPAD